MSRPRTKDPIAVGNTYQNKQVTRNRIVVGLSEPSDGLPDYDSNRTVTYLERSVKEPAYGNKEKSCSLRSFYVWAAAPAPTTTAA